MLRYNNQASLSKPVDYYRPLTVDVSVEYELPKEVAPPKGSAPLLIIHPSAYFRSKLNQPSSNPQQLPQSPHPTSQKNGPGSLSSKANGSGSSSGRLGDIASTLYYLSTGGGVPSSHNQPHATSTAPTNHHQAHIKSLRSSYGNNTMSSSSSSSTTGSSAITRSRSVAMGNSGGSMSMNCSYGNCDECSSTTTHSSSSHPRNLPPYHSSSSSRVNSNNSSSAIKKIHQQQHQVSTERLMYSNGSMGQQMSSNNSSSPASTFMGTAPGPINFLGNSIINSHPNGSSTTATTSTSNKRLRMMNQQQQAQHPNPIMHNPPPQPMEPLNLAITPSAANSLLNPSYHNNQFSTFLGYSLPGSGAAGGSSGRVNGSPAPPHGLAHLHYASTFPNQSITMAPTNLYSAQSARMSSAKEVPVPVEKGSGSDSGVCSENDSDVSPPMAPFPGQPRRSAVLSQELPSSGKESAFKGSFLCQ